MSKGIGSIVKNLPKKKKSPELDGIPGEYYKIFKDKKSMAMFLKLLQKKKKKTEWKKMLQISFYEASVSLVPKPGNLTTRK